MDTPKDHIDFLQGTRELATLAGGTPLGASATANGQTYDVGQFNGLSQQAGAPNPLNAGRNGAAYFRAFASANQTGTLNIQQSPDGINWFKTDSVAVTASFTTGVYLESKVVLRYVRAQLVNGSTAQTQVEFDTALVSI